MKIIASDHCTCIHRTPTAGAAATKAGYETGMSFNRYLAPLLTEMLYSSAKQSALPAGSLASLLPLLWGAGQGSTAYAPHYSGYRRLSLPSHLQPDSRLNLRLQSFRHLPFG